MLMLQHIAFLLLQGKCMCYPFIKHVECLGGGSVLITGHLKAESEQVTATMRDRQRKAGWGARGLTCTPRPI